MAFNAIYTPQNIRFETDEDKLRTRLGELRNMLKQANQPVDATTLEADRLKAGANAYMKYVVPVATEMLQKSEALASKQGERQDLNAQKKIALDQYNEAISAWQRNKEGNAEQQGVLSALANARQYGLALTNPISNYVQEKQFGATMDLKKSEADFKRIMDEKSNAREDKRVSISMAQLDLDRKKFEADLAKTQTGAKLPAETTAKISNLQTVLTSIKDIQELLDEVTTNPSLTGIQELRYTIKLASENLGRVQSGGAITSDELVTFRNLIAPGALDVIDGFVAYKNNVQRLTTSISNKISNLASEGKLITTAPTGTPQPTQPAKPAQSTGKPPLMAPR